MAGNVASKDLFVVARKEPEAGEKYNKQGSVIRAVLWIYEKKDGSTGNSVKLEKRQLFIADDGSTRTGKAEGFTLEDLGLIQRSWAEIVKAMRNAPKEELEQKLADAPKEVEEVPW